jgi:hypothetical protein
MKSFLRFRNARHGEPPELAPKNPMVPGLVGVIPASPRRARLWFDIRRIGAKKRARRGVTAGLRHPAELY